jgi:predicted RNase H-like HicB family nuclease
MQLKATIERDEVGTCVAEIPKLPGCHTQANDIPSLIESIKEAAELYAEEFERLPKMEFIGLQLIDISA